MNDIYWLEIKIDDVMEDFNILFNSTGSYTL